MKNGELGESKRAEGDEQPGPATRPPNTARQIRTHAESPVANLNFTSHFSAAV